MLKWSLIAATCLAPIAASAETPRICYRDDAAPFSFVNKADEPTGYSVGLCKRVLSAMGHDAPEMVLVNAEDRFNKLAAKSCDLLCEATTVTMKRRAEMEFSLITFLTGTVLLFPKDLLDAKVTQERTINVGVLSKTTAFDKWQSGELSAGDGVDFVFEEQKSHETAEAALKNGTLHAYIADREIIEQFLANDPALAATHKVSNTPLSYEPYALAVRMGDDALRTQVDEVLAELYRSGDILDLLDEFLPGRSDDAILTGLFELQSLPE